MTAAVECIVILGSTVTALALARNCREIELPCVMIDTEKGPAAYSRIPNVKLVSSATEQTLVDLLLETASGKACALVADSDRWLRWLSERRDVLDSHFSAVLHPANPVLNICLDKSTFLQWCEENQVLAPKLYGDEEARRLVGEGWPVLIRPRLTRHNLHDELPKACEVTNIAALRALQSKYDQSGISTTISQSLLDREVVQYSVGIARNENSQECAFVAEKVRPPSRFCAGGTYVVASQADDVYEFALTVARKLGLVGIAELEIFKNRTNDALYVIEVNARPWVQYSLAWRSGFDYLTFLLDPQAYDPSLQNKGAKSWLSFGDDMYVVLSRSEGMIRSGELGWLSYLRTVAFADVFPYWDWNDRGPWIHYFRQSINARFR